ncbi:MAG: hypothetical protein DRJ60_00005 [Thermoprotei archaeon]|nr:MAG: hypothetical protein DRJ60_00005 [Thermoprotei archaeon]
MEKIEIIKTGRVEFEVKFCGKRKFLLGFYIPSEKRSVGFQHAKMISLNNRSFFIATRWLWKDGYREELASLLRLCGYNVSKSQLEELYREADRYAEGKVKKFTKMLKNWGLPYEI